jgi:hypothetical protein
MRSSFNFKDLNKKLVIQKQYADYFISRPNKKSRSY